EWSGGPQQHPFRRLLNHELGSRTPFPPPSNIAGQDHLSLAGDRGGCPLRVGHPRSSNKALARIAPLGIEETPPPSAHWRPVRGGFPWKVKEAALTLCNHPFAPVSLASASGVSMSVAMPGSGMATSATCSLCSSIRDL